jgi:hypothetical protein
MRVLPAIFVRIVPSCDVNRVLLIRKLTSPCRPRLALAAQSEYSKTSQCNPRQLLVRQVQDSLPAGLPVQKRFRGLFANLSTVKRKSKAESKTNRRKSQWQINQIQFQSEKGETQQAIGRQTESTFVTRNNGNRFTIDALLLIQSAKEEVTLMYHRLC